MRKNEFDDVLKRAVDKGLSKAGVKKEKVLEEAYVAEPKVYRQPTEFVTQKTKDAHVKLYNEYVETTNKVSAQLDSLGQHDANSRHSTFRSLKLDESYNVNATWLHELFFAGMFDPHSEVYVDSLSFMKLERDFGTFEQWQKDFMACALSAGEGWAVCGYNLYLQRYVNTVISHHNDNVMVGLYPIIVLDMWAHSYWRDYLEDKQSYVTAMMRQIDWNVVEERVTKTEKIAGVLK